MGARIIQGFFLGGARLAPASPRPGAGRGGPASRSARAAPPSGAGHRAPVVQRFGGDESFAVDPAQVGLVRSGGAPLPGALLAKMEAAFGADFSGVRVHVGPQASRIGALAFTTGNDLYFAPGQYQPDSIKGQQLIGHELAHVIQQRQGRVRAPGSGAAVVQDRALEAEADRLGMKAAAHRVSHQPQSCVADHRRGVVQCSSMPKDYATKTSKYQVSTLRQHNAGIKKGRRQLALPLFGLNRSKGTKKADAKAFIVPIVDHSKRADETHFAASVKNIVNFTWGVAKNMPGMTGKTLGANQAKQTEAVGEAAAFVGMTSNYPDYSLSFPVNPGHGAGIDQLYEKTKGKKITYMIVEAKGPGQKLSKGQMDHNWVTTRIGRLSRSGNKAQMDKGDLVNKALASAEGDNDFAKVIGYVFTARWDKNGNLTYSRSHKKRYNYTR